MKRHYGRPQRLFIEDDPSVSILLEKYKLLRAEAVQNSATNNRQVTYIQVYGVFLFFVSGVFFGFNDSVPLTKIPDYFRLPVLILSASLLFYYYSQIYLSSFTFRILRLRMAEIESELNRKVSANLLYYERLIAPKFFGKASLDGKQLLPNAWLQFFTLVLFGTAVYVLAALAVNLLEKQPGWAIFYIGNLSFFAFILVWENFRFSRPGSIILQEARSSTPNSLFTSFWLSRYFLNYIVVMIISYVALFNQLGDPLSAFTTRIISEFFSSIGTMQESTILLGTMAYTALCGLFLPTPSELPLTLINVVGTFKIFVAASVGKSLGSVALFFASSLFFKINHHKTDRVRSALESGPTKNFFGGGKLGLVYVVSQSIPFAPMRSATIAYSAITPVSVRSTTVVAIGSFVGTISRMLLVGVFVSAGVWVLPTLLGVAP